MKIKITFLLIVFLGLYSISCKQNAADKIDDSEAEMAKERARLAKVGFPVMTFVSNEYDFGTANEGDKIEGSFEYTNTGKSDLIISSAKASCGCTVPEYDKDKPIKPGEKGSLKFVFDTHGKPDKQNKSITIVCNTKNQQEVVNIKGFVNRKTDNTAAKNKFSNEKRPELIDPGM
jgi:hypothetical protein